MMSVKLALHLRWTGPTLVGFLLLPWIIGDAGSLVAWSAPRQDQAGRFFDPGAGRVNPPAEGEVPAKVAAEIPPASPSHPATHPGTQDPAADPDRPKLETPAEQEQEPDRSQRVTREQIANSVAQIAARENLDSEQREVAQQLLASASQQIDAYELLLGQIEETEKALGRIPESLRKLQQRTGEVRDTPEVWVERRTFFGIQLEDLQELIRSTEAELDRLNKTLASRRTEVERRPGRLIEIPTRINELEAKVAQVRQQLNTGPPAGEASDISQARSLLRQAEWMSAETEIRALQREQERYRAARDLLPLQIEYTLKDLQYYGQILNLLKGTLDRMLTEKFQQIREQSQQRLAETWPLLKAFVQHDLLDLNQIEESNQRTRAATLQFEAIKKQRLELETEFKNLQERHRAVGGSSALGMTLRQTLKKNELIRSSIADDRLRDEAHRRQAEEWDVLLKNEFNRDKTLLPQLLKQRALQAASLSRFNELDPVVRQLSENNFEIVRDLSGLPIVGLPHRDALGFMTNAMAEEILQLKPQLNSLIENLKTTARSAFLLNQNEPAVQQLAVLLFLLQNEKQSLGEEDQNWLQDFGWNLLVNFGEEQFLRQAEERVADRAKMIQNQLKGIDEEKESLASLDVERQITTKLLKEFSTWADERIIWIRGTSIPALSDLQKLRQAVQWFASIPNWKSVVSDVRASSREGWFGFFPIALLLVLILAAFKFRLYQLLKASGELASKRFCMKITPTARGLLATLLLAVIWPLATFLLGRLLVSSSGPNGFAAAVGQSLTDISYFLAALELLRWLCVDQGLAVAHFGWPEKMVQFIRNKIRSLYATAIPLLFIQGMMISQGNDDLSESLGRLASLLLFAVIAVYMHSIFKPRGVIFQQLASQGLLPGLYSMRHFIHVLGVAIPVSLSVLTLIGYYYAAYRLGASLEKSLLLIVSILYVGGVLFRWLLITRRSQAMEEARRIREEMERNPERVDGSGEGTLTPVEQLMEELLTVNRQSREAVLSLLWLAGFGILYFIWKDLLPAVGGLSQSPLWTVSVGSDIKEVNLMSLFNAGLTSLVTWLLIKNMPGLLNMAVQTYSSLDSGARYAATTLFRYLITIVGAITALNFLHIQWAQYGWLVAAISVGLGFGLQEIVGNFISGLILLFERPLRIGDTITVDNQTGVVTRIQMRATTIRNWDQQELIIPNKDLMTGKLLNWTLSNSNNRLVLQVGVAYGNDPDHVRNVLLAVVDQHPDVLKDPPPNIVLEEFGDNSLLFLVRCILNSMESRSRVRHEINTAIARAFEREKISIPFPQLDLHIVSDQRPQKTAADPPH
jgi:small-conductance mechanosensitive channel